MLALLFLSHQNLLSCFVLGFWELLAITRVLISVYILHVGGSVTCVHSMLIQQQTQRTWYYGVYSKVAYLASMKFQSLYVFIPLKYETLQCPLALVC